MSNISEIYKTAQDIRLSDSAQDTLLTAQQVRKPLLWALRRIEAMRRQVESEDWTQAGTKKLKINDDDSASIAQKRQTQIVLKSSLIVLERQIESDLTNREVSYSEHLALIDKILTADEFIFGSENVIESFEDLASSVNNTHSFMKLRWQESSMEKLFHQAKEKGAVVLPFVGYFSTDEMTDLILVGRILAIGLIEKPIFFDGRTKISSIGAFGKHDIDHSRVILTNMSDDRDEDRALQLAYKRKRSSVTDHIDNQLLRFLWFEILHERSMDTLNRQGIKSFLNPNNPYRKQIFQAMIESLRDPHHYEDEFPELVDLARKNKIDEHNLSEIAQIISIYILQ